MSRSEVCDDEDPYDGPGWSVRLELEREEAIAMASPETMVFDEHASLGSYIGGFNPRSRFDLDDAPFATLNLRYDDPGSAVFAAQAVLRETQRLAGLPRRVATVAWVTPIETNLSHRFLDQAAELFESEQYDLAIVAAHIHLESQLRLVLKRHASPEDLPSIERIGSLVRKEQSDLVRRVLGVDPRSLGRTWEDYRASVARRNSVVHGAHHFRQHYAEDSLRVVRELWLVLSRAGLELDKGRLGPRARRERP